MNRVIRLRHVLRSVQPDVAVGFMLSAYVPVAIAAIGLNTSIVASEHITYAHYADRRVDRIALRGTARLYDRTVVISEAAKRGFSAAFVERSEVIRNPVATPNGVSADPAGGAQKTLLNIGRLTRQKDQETLLRAFAKIAPAHPKWHLRIIGEGELRSQLEQVANDLGIGARVDLPGEAADIWPEYANAQLFVMSSRYESFGMATAEALAVGLPAIGFADCPGTNELIQDGVNGALVAGTDRVEALAQALDRLMSSANERIRLSTSAPASMRPFALSGVVNAWESLFERLQR